MSDNSPGQNPEIPPAPPAYGAPAQPSAYPPPAYGAPAQPVYPPPAYPQYAQAPYGAAPAYPAGPKTNVLAVISMIASIAGFIWILPFIGSLAGVIMGHISLRQLSTSGESGRGMALAGVIVGYVGLGLFLIGAIAFFAFLAFAASQGARYNDI